MPYKPLDIEEYKGLPVQTTNGPFDRRILERTYQLFAYANRTQSFQGRFMRVDFNDRVSLLDVKKFYEFLTKYHRRAGKPFLYMMTVERSKLKGLHFHSYVIAHYQDYGEKAKLSAKIKKLWNPNELDYLDKAIWVPGSKRLPNFYSISEDPRARPGERQEAFKAASYLAKVSQLPNLPKGTRRMRSSQIRKQKQF